MATQKLSGEFHIKKDIGEADWEVLIGDKTIGWLYKEHHKGSSRPLKRYIGSFGPYDTWNFQPEDIDAAPEGNWDSFKEAKEGIPAFVKQHSL